MLNWRGEEFGYTVKPIILFKKNKCKTKLMVLNNSKVDFYRQLVKYIILYKNMKKTRDNIKQKILREDGRKQTRCDV